MALTNNQTDAALTRLKSTRDAMDESMGKQDDALKPDSINKGRFHSVNHAQEAARGVEICVRCQPKYNDLGDLLGVIHLRLPVEDFDGEKDGQPTRFNGLRSNIKDGTLTVDADGVLQGLAGL